MIDTGEGVHPGNELGDGEPGRHRRQCQGGAQRVAAAGFVEVDTADPGGTQPGTGGQLVEEAFGEEPGVHTIQGGGEPLDHPASRVTISGTFSIIRPQPACLTAASNLKSVGSHP